MNHAPTPPTPSMQYAQVALPVPLPRVFDYTVPNPLPVDDACVRVDALVVGARVRVSFSGRTLIGVVVRVSDESAFVEQSLAQDQFQDQGIDIESLTAKLKPIDAVLDAEPILTPELFQLAEASAKYYHYPLGEVLNCFLPNALAKGKYLIEAEQPYWRVSESGQNADAVDALKSEKQKRVLNAMRQSLCSSSGSNHRKAWSADEMNAEFGTGQWRTHIKALIQKGLVDVNALPDPIDYAPQAGLALNSGQKTAVETISAKNQFDVYLLHGITGSGKTEVYMHLIAQSLEKEEQVLVLVPEIGLTPQLVGRFLKRFNVRVVCMHSGMTDLERLHAWYLAKTGRARIVIGTRSALFTPMPELGLVIIDEEHDASFKQQEGFRYHARDMAIMRAKMADIPIVLGSATPSLESLHNAEQGRYTQLNLTERAGGAKPPRLIVVDSRRHFDGALTPQLQEAMQRHLSAGQQVMLFLNRRGFAPVLNCPSCGWHATCERCDANMTLHKFTHSVHCHHCAHEHRAPNVCPECSYQHLETNGLGTEQLEEQVNALFPDYRILRIDRDSTSKKGALEACFEQVNNGEVDIVLGTQLLAKGHHFPRVTLVGVLDCDRGFFSADFRGTEHTGQMLLQVAGRAGREETAGEVMIQSTQPDNLQLHTLIIQGYTAFAKACMSERTEADFPPVAHMALLRAESVHKANALAFLDEVASGMRQPAIDVLGPIPAPMEKRAGRFRAQAMFIAKERAPLHLALNDLTRYIDGMKLKNTVRWSLDVDPISTF